MVWLWDEVGTFEAVSVCDAVLVAEAVLETLAVPDTLEVCVELGDIDWLDVLVAEEVSVTLGVRVLLDELEPLAVND